MQLMASVDFVAALAKDRILIRRLWALCSHLTKRSDDRLLSLMLEEGNTIDVSTGL